MFTGIISDVGEIVDIKPLQKGLHRLRISSRFCPSSIQLGASIACGGPCLTVINYGAQENGAWFEVDAAAETLALTTLETWKVGTKVNLERALKIGDELGGHLVTGHVDGIAEIIACEELTSHKNDDDKREAERSVRFTLKVPFALAPFIASKGSVALDGTSLTVNNVEQDLFSVLVIPHTLQVTTWGDRTTGDSVNIEVDLMARYAARLAQAK